MDFFVAQLLAISDRRSQYAMASSDAATRGYPDLHL